MQTETRRPFDLYTVNQHGEHEERIATGLAYPDEVHRVAWSEAVNTGETVAIVWADTEDVRASSSNGDT